MVISSNKYVKYSILLCSGIQPINILLALINFSPDSMSISDLRENGVSSVRDCIIINKNHEGLYNDRLIYSGKLIVYLKSKEENEKFNEEKDIFQVFVCEGIDFPLELRWEKYYPSYDL